MKIITMLLLLLVGCALPYNMSVSPDALSTRVWESPERPGSWWIASEAAWLAPDNPYHQSLGICTLVVEKEKVGPTKEDHLARFRRAVPPQATLLNTRPSLQCSTTSPL